MNTSLSSSLSLEHSYTLIVHPDIARLREIGAEISSRYALEAIHIGAELSAALIEVTPQQRPSVAHHWLTDRLRQGSRGPIIYGGIDLLFEPALRLDPFALFKNASRLSPVIVLWPGTYHEGVLAYAVPEHQHYRTWRELGSEIRILTETTFSP